MKKLNLVTLLLTLLLTLSIVGYAQDSKIDYYPEPVKEFNENLFNFLGDGDYSLLENYITSSTQIIKGKKLFGFSTDSDKEIFEKEFTEGNNVKGAKINAWSSDGKYYYMILESSPNSESANYNSIFIEVTEKNNVTIKVWHKS